MEPIEKAVWITVIITIVIFLAYIALTQFVPEANAEIINIEDNPVAISGSKSSADSKNINKAYGGKGGIALQGQHQYQDQYQDQANAQDTTITQTYQARKREASSAISAALVASGCWGSIAGAGQGTVFGVSLGKAYESENCVILRTSAILWDRANAFLEEGNDVKAGLYEEASFNVLCQDRRVREAIGVTKGLDCPIGEMVAPEASVDQYAWLNN